MIWSVILWNEYEERGGGAARPKSVSDDNPCASVRVPPSRSADRDPPTGAVAHPPSRTIRATSASTFFAS